MILSDKRTSGLCPMAVKFTSLEKDQSGLFKCPVTRSYFLTLGRGEVAAMFFRAPVAKDISLNKRLECLQWERADRFHIHPHQLGTAKPHTLCRGAWTYSRFEPASDIHQARRLVIMSLATLGKFISSAWLIEADINSTAVRRGFQLTPVSSFEPSTVLVRIVQVNTLIHGIYILIMRALCHAAVLSTSLASGFI